MISPIGTASPLSGFPLPPISSGPSISGATGYGGGTGDFVFGGRDEPINAAQSFPLMLIALAVIGGAVIIARGAK